MADKTNFSKEIRAFAAQVQALEDAVFDVYSKRNISDAVTYGLDAVLDGFGEIVGESRLARNNSDYATAIRARIQMNASKGEPERMIAALKAITGSAVVTYRENYPASVAMEYEGITIPANLAKTMQKIAPAGVRVTINKTIADPFICTSLDGTGTPIIVSDSVGLGLSSLAEPTHGGKLSALVI